MAESVLVSVLQSFVVWKVGYMYLFYLQATDGCELPGALPSSLSLLLLEMSSGESEGRGQKPSPVLSHRIVSSNVYSL